jgi:hypothetical protein
MSQDMIKQNTRELDGFEGFEDGIEGDDNAQSTSIIQGTRVKFTNEAKWVTYDGEQLPSERELVGVDILRIVQKWPPGDNNNNEPPKTTTLEPGQKFPDVDELNAKTPRAEWRTGPAGQPVGPYERAYVVYLLDPQTVARFTYITPTMGGGIAVRDLAERVEWMRKFRSARVYPVVTLSNTYMPTRYGGRQRPHFNIKRWVTFGSTGDVLPAADSPQLTGPKVVEPPTAKEVTDDEILF